jgi:hypothetical protein
MAVPGRLYMQAGWEVIERVELDQGLVLMASALFEGAVYGQVVLELSQNCRADASGKQVFLVHWMEGHH